MEQKESYFPYPNMGISSGQDISAYNSGAYPGTPVAAYTPDPLAAPELGAIPNAAQAVPAWNEPIYEPQVSGMVLRPSPGAVVPPGAMPHPSTGPMAVTPDATGILPVNMSTAGFGGSPHDSTAWGGQISRSMSLSARPGVPSPIPQAYPSQYHPSPPINPEFKRRMTTPAESYSGLGHVPSVPQLPSTPVPVSYDEAQIPFTTYNMSGAISGQVIVGSAADPMSLSEWEDGETPSRPPPPPHHRLGPKANQGAINACLRALDRSGKPCRKWERKSFQLKSFTGVIWQVPSWGAPPRPKPTPEEEEEKQKEKQATTNGEKKDKEKDKKSEKSEKSAKSEKSEKSTSDPTEAEPEAERDPTPAGSMMDIDSPAPVAVAS
ncbi:INO80 complex subunit [Trichophyton mentagrophytes]|nr:INO80 complex subunit [Trichophyton mentagrophytes]